MSERTTDEPNPDHTSDQPTIIVTDGGRRSSGAGWLIGIVLLAALIAGIFLFMRGSESETARDNAVAKAAGQVGDAAQQVGNAAQDAADNLKK